MSQYRSGRQALLELGIISPLALFGFTKEEIRVLSKELGLKTANQASFSCLATRFCYGDRISQKKLEKIEKAEDIFSQLGFKQFRLRNRKNICRIEVLKEELFKVLEKKEYIIKELKNLGFNYITLDLEGFRSGSLDETIKKQ